MADSGAAGKLSVSSAGGGGVSRGDGRLVIGGVKAGDGNGPRVFLLSAVKADRPTDGSGGSASAPSGRVSLLRTAAEPPSQQPGAQSKLFTTDTSVPGKRLRAAELLVGDMSP